VGEIVGRGAVAVGLSVMVGSSAGVSVGLTTIGVVVDTIVLVACVGNGKSSQARSPKMLANNRRINPHSGILGTDFWSCSLI
jgi:hypothetical protein